MSRNIIEVPITRRAYAVKEMMWQDPTTKALGIRGREWTSPETARTEKLEVYDSSGNTLYAWNIAEGPLNQNKFKAANYLSRQSFEAKGVM